MKRIINQKLLIGILILTAKISLAQEQSSIDDLGSFLEKEYAIPRITQSIDKLKKTSQVETRIITLEEKDSLYQYTVEEGENSESAKKLILFIYLKNKQVNQIDFKLNPSLEEQIPEIVAAYIKDKILTPALRSGIYVEAITQTLNAFKNATDPRFKEKLLSVAPPMLNESIYFPDHAYDDFPYHDFEAYHESSFSLENIFPSYDLVSNQDYITWSSDYKLTDELIVERIKVIEDALIPDGYSIQKLESEKIAVPSESNAGLRNYKSLENDLKEICINPLHKAYDETIESGYHDKSNLKKIFRYKHVGCRVRIIKAKAIPGQPISKQGLDAVYSGGVTWCNKYAEDVAEKIFGFNPWGGELTANAIYDKLSSDTENFVQISSNLETNKQPIWDKFINNGYIVFFSYKDGKPKNPHGHIEIGWPDENGITQMTIGAGRKNSKKSFLNEPNRGGFSSSFGNINRQEIKAFLYLGYLKMNFN